VRPLEMLLLGLGGCTAFDVVSILRKSRQQLVDCEVEIEAERAESIPKVFTKIHLHFIVSGRDLDQGKVAKAIDLSADKYCSASRMLEKTAAITHDFEIVNPD
jgi:putative redox protein